jgi:pimeloyl-ACP methyl ester carboxylesterase
MKEFNFKDKIYYRMNEFKPGRMTLIFVHGVAGSSSAWLPYEKIFEDKYNILSYDIRGHGKSKKFLRYSDYEIRNFASDLHELIDHLHFSKFILVSNSFGALICLEYLKSWRETVIGNVFTSPEVYLEKTLPAKILRPILKILNWVLSLLPFNPKPRGHVDYRKHINSTDWNIKRNIADMKNTTPRVHFYTLRQSVIPRQEYFLEKIDVPTLIIHGEKDTMVPIKNVVAMSKKIKNSIFMNIPNIDHNTAHNAVKVISEAIESFIEKHYFQKN